MAKNEEIKLSDWIDISVPVKSGMVHWPGDPECTIAKVRSMSDGAICNLTTMQMSVHTGTHMDAPLHFIAGGRSIDTMPLSATVGSARVIEIEDRVRVTAAELEGNGVETGERLLLKTANSGRCWKTDNFVEDFVYVSDEAAQFLVEKKVLCVGVDYLSVGGFKTDSVETHVTLLGAGIWVIEGLDLSAVSAGHYDLVCLPLKLIGAEGAPARAIVHKDPWSR